MTTTEPFSLAAQFVARWPGTRFGAVFGESLERNGQTPAGPALSVSEYRGVIPRETGNGQEESEDVSNYRVVRPGQLAVNVMWLNRSGLGVSEHTGYVSPAYKVFRILDSYAPRFADYLLRSGLYRAVFESLGRGVRPNAQMVESSELAAMHLPLPPFPEQRAIADYLDRETARIDTLIEEQQRLIELLRERRRDFIRAAVLSDENPFAPSAGSAFTAIGYHFSVTLGKMLDAGKAVRSDDQTLPYIRAGNIQDSGLKLSDVNEMPYSAVEAANLSLLAGDLLVVEGGAVGTNVVVTEDMTGWSFQKTVNRVRPQAEWSAPWLGYVLRTYRDLGVLEIVCHGSTIPHLTAEKLRGLRVPDVSLEEQRRIARYLDEQTAKIDALIAETESFIELSRERRSALITAAVTGQIDVRDTPDSTCT